MYSNSSLVTFRLLSPNFNPRNSDIDTITIHHVAGNLSVQAIGNIFQPRERQASSNYGVDTDGNIGLYVEEKNRAWTSSNPQNDHRAVTIEVANNSGAPNWTVSDKAYEATIELCTDICIRNSIPCLTYTGTPDGSLTRHNMFSATSCPGPFLQARFPDICNRVNENLINSIRGTDLDTFVNVSVNGVVSQIPAINRNGFWYVHPEFADRPVRLRNLFATLDMDVSWNEQTRTVHAMTKAKG